LNHATAHTTGYARLTRLQARAVAIVLVLVLGAAAAVTLSPLASSNLKEHPNQAGDVQLYRAEVDRIHRGEGYYQAAAAELTARGYPTQSVFNWRTPLPMWLLGKLPAVAFGKALLGAMALALMLMAFEALAREEPSPGDGSDSCGAANGPSPTDTLTAKMGLYPLTHFPSAHPRGIGPSCQRHAFPVACVLLLTGPLLPTILGDLFVLPVLWAGVLIALSACAYGVNRPWLGVAFGLAAVFFRDLALPYCLVCAAMAWRQGRRSELAVWTFGLFAWLVLFGLHWWRISELIAPGAHAHREGWIRFGGAGFVISTAQMNAYLLLLPQWVTAVYLVAALVGLAGWNTPLGVRIGLSTCVFLAAFAVVGHSFNQYWGSLIAPLLCFGVARLPASLGDLWRAAFFHKPAVVEHF
jgi:hypothetical protein